MVKQKGWVLLEITVALLIVTVVGLSVAALLRADARELRMLYEERVAWEVAAGRLEVLEADPRKPLREGEAEIPIDSPGWENLPEGKCVLRVSPVEEGLVRVHVEVSWTGEQGVRRRVEARSLLGTRP